MSDSPETRPSDPFGAEFPAPAASDIPEPAAAEAHAPGGELPPAEPPEPPEPPEPRAPDVRRLHPSALLFDLFQTLRSLLAPGIAVLYFSSGEGWEQYAMLGIVPVGAFQVVRYLTLHYELREREIVVRQGLFNRNERHIPLDRIQDLDTRQSPVHRLLGVAAVRLRTATDGAPEAELTALSGASIAELRLAITGARRRSAKAAANPVPGVRPAASESESESAAAASAASARGPRLRLGVRDLTVLGLVRNRGLIAIAATLGIASQYGLYDRLGDLPFFQRLGSLPGLGVVAGIVFSVGGLLTLVAASPLLSIPWTLLRYGNFQLELDGDHLRIEKGLWTRTTLALPRHRIQRLSIVESPLHRLFGVVSVHAVNAGRSGADQGAVGGSELVPILERRLLRSFLRTFTPEFQLEGEWRPPHPRAGRRLLRVAVLGPALLGLLLARPLGLWALPIVGLLLLIGVPRARREARWLAWSVSDTHVASRIGAYVRRTIVAPVSKLQTADERESVFDRRWGMRHLRLDTAGGLGVRPLELRFMDAADSERLRRRLAEQVDHSDFRW